MFELEGVINSWDCCFKCLNRPIPIFPKEQIVLKPKDQKLIKVKAPFIDEISGLAIIKILDGSTYSTMLIKLKFTCNTAILDIVNNGTETVIFKPEEMLGIVDLRSLGYYKIKQGILQQNLSKYHRFEGADTLCEYFNKFINTLKSKGNRKNWKKSIHGQTPVMREMHDRPRNIEQIHRFRKVMPGRERKEKGNGNVI